MNPLLLILILILLFGTGGSFYGGYHGAGISLGTVLLIILIVLICRRL